MDVNGLKIKPVYGVSYIRKGCSTTVQRTICDLCNSEEERTIYKNAPWFSRQADVPEEYNIVKCNNCGLVRLNPTPPKALMEAYYPQEHFEGYVFTKTIDQLIFKIYYKITRNIPLIKKGKLLDAGCGTGKYLRFLRDLGWEVYGTEPSRFACGYAKNHWGLNVFNGDLLDAEFPSDFFDVVTMWASFEHVNNPSRLLQEIHRILKKGGILLLGDVPNFEGVDQSIFRENDFYLGVPYHPYFYSPLTLKSLLEKTGFTAEVHFDYLSPTLLCWNLLYNLGNKIGVAVPIQVLKYFGILFSPFFTPINILCSSLGRGSLLNAYCRKD